MTEPQSQSQSPLPPQPHISLSRVLMVVVPVAIIGLAAYVWSRQLEPNARNEMAINSFTRILAANVATASGTMKYPDKDGDLVADSPDDPKQCIDPKELTFSFIAGESNVHENDWKEFLAALKQKTGHEVKYVQYDTVDDQLRALDKGELHIAGLNTGFVPAAVQHGGFVPVCAFGHDDGTCGITMQVLVPADSPIKNLAGLKDHKIMFTRPDSNSGCKALLTLLNEQGIQPDRDYSWGFSTGHKESIRGVATKLYEAAPVASDIFQLMVKSGEVDDKAVRVLYESKNRFPSATIGYVYNLTPELRTSIRDTLKDYSLKGTGLEGKMGPDATKLVPVDYKKDWESARQIDKLAVEARSKRAG